MNIETSDRDLFRAVLFEHAAEHAGEHPDHETLVGYLAGDLAAAAEARVNDHLVGCRQCTATLLDLEPLAQPDAGMPEGVADLATAAAWRDLQHRLFSEKPRVRPVDRRWATAVAASLLVATLGMSLWVNRLQGTVADLRARESQPLVNMPIFTVREVTRSAEVETIEVPAEMTLFGLIFTPATLESYAEYEVRFLDLEDREVLRRDGLVQSDLGGLRLGLPRGLLPAGDYRVLLSGSKGDSWEPVEEYRRRIVYLDH